MVLMTQPRISVFLRPYLSPTRAARGSPSRHPVMGSPLMTPMSVALSSAPAGVCTEPNWLANGVMAKTPDVTPPS